MCLLQSIVSVQLTFLHRVSGVYIWSRVLLETRGSRGFFLRIHGTHFSSSLVETREHYFYADLGLYSIILVQLNTPYRDVNTVLTPITVIIIIVSILTSELLINIVCAIECTLYSIVHCKSGFSGLNYIQYTVKLQGCS